MFPLPPARNSMVIEVYAVLDCTVSPIGSYVLGANLNCSESCWHSTARRLLQCGIAIWSMTGLGQSRRIRTFATLLACPLCLHSDPIGASQQNVACHKRTSGPPIRS